MRRERNEKEKKQPNDGGLSFFASLLPCILWVVSPFTNRRNENPPKKHTNPTTHTLSGPSRSGLGACMLYTSHLPSLYRPSAQLRSRLAARPRPLVLTAVAIYAARQRCSPFQDHIFVMIIINLTLSSQNPPTIPPPLLARQKFAGTAVSTRSLNLALSS